jgi:hypothetical protein
MQAEGGLAIVRARLPYIDRRALPEAWFSALHFAVAPGRGSRGGAARAPARLAKGVAVRSSARSSAPAAFEPAAVRPGHAGAPRKASAPAPVHAARKDARLRPAPFAPRSYPAARVAFTVGLSGARVQLLVRREGAVLHVVALCNERHVALVRGALADAALHLARRGDLVNSCVRPFVRVAG